MPLRFQKVKSPLDAHLLATIVRSYPEMAQENQNFYERYGREISDVENREIYVAKDDSDICIGFGQLLLLNADNDPELANGTEIAHVHDLRVKFALQGRGLAKEFMCFLESAAAEMGKRTLTLGVDNWNNRAIALYKGLGYREFKIENGRTDDEKVICMRKILC